MADAHVDPASFRDPDSSVFDVDGRVLRGLSERAASDWKALAATGFFPRVVEDGLVVRTTEVQDELPPSPRGTTWSLVLEHERIPFVSHPFEWPFSMLRDAALCELDVLLAALDERMTLKDGTAYNVQFIGTRPTFIDVGSFEKATGPWPGYRQFCRTMLFPLLIQAHLGIPFQPLLRGRVDGLEPREVSGMFRGRRKWKKGVFRNVTLHAVAERKVTAGTERTKQDMQRAGFGVELAKATAKKLRKLVAHLDVPARESTWSEYRDTCSYSDDDAGAKRRFVGEVAAAREPGTVLDLGANDGEYSALVAPSAGYVVAADFDEAVIDGLARRVRAGGPANVLPLVVDLTDPSPSLGWRNRERASFESRARSDLVLALALVHHLAIGANVPLPSVVQWLRDLSAPAVVELPHEDDPMTKRLLANKPAGLFNDYRRDHFETLLHERFTVERAETLPGGTRTLYAVSPR